MSARLLRWQDVYSEAELYKSAVRVYAKPLFHWRKALATSTDDRTLYDLAGRGLRGLDQLHRSLRAQTFAFRPARALAFNFNGRRRTLYVSPWEERIVDLMLYRVLTRRLHRWFSPHSYAYRDRTFGLDLCQARIARALGGGGPVFVVKRDIADYFASVDHGLLLDQLRQLVDPADRLFELLRQRVEFQFEDAGEAVTAPVGIPFGAATACLFANVHLTALDRRMEAIAGAEYFRYADDILVLARSRDAADAARAQLAAGLAGLRLETKPSHELDLELGAGADSFRHLGLQFRAGGGVALARDKSRKLQNLFRFAFRRARRRWAKLSDPEQRARALVEIARATVERGVRHVAILDYYLKHVSDEAQLARLDRWLAEEVLALVFGGHKQGNFRRMPFARLRALGLPSLVHRRRLIRHRHIASPFFVWRQQRSAAACKGTVARPRHEARAFSPSPEAAADPKPVGEGGCLSMGVME